MNFGSPISVRRARLVVGAAEPHYHKEPLHGNQASASVWVIPETVDLPTKFAKVVVTDDQGRYVLPDLPKANVSLIACWSGAASPERSSATS